MSNLFTFVSAPNNLSHISSPLTFALCFGIGTMFNDISFDFKRLTRLCHGCIPEAHPLEHAKRRHFLLYILVGFFHEPI